MKLPRIKERRCRRATNRPPFNYHLIFLLQQVERYAYSVNAKVKRMIDAIHISTIQKCIGTRGLALYCARDGAGKCAPGA
jgi:hypothetical protein